MLRSLFLRHKRHVRENGMEEVANSHSNRDCSIPGFRPVRVILLSVLASAICACGGGGGGNSYSGTSSGGTAPSALQYTSPETTVVGTSLTLSPTVSGSVSSYSISPDLPAGLSLNATTGAITGTSTAATAQATYTITASNSAASTSFGLVLTVNPVAPSALSYTSPVTALVGTPASLAPTVTGSVATYTIAPALPSGLSIDQTSGVISGTPSEAAATAAYTITASNVTGNTSFALSITVNPAAPTNLSYGTPAPPPMLVGKSASLTPTVSSTVTQFSVSPTTLPVGLTFNTTTGVISGTPTVATPPGTQDPVYTITATNVTGSTTAQVPLEVDSGPIIALTVAATGAQSYYWKATDGQFVGANRSPICQPPAACQVTGAQASWQIPQGPGLHFAYALVVDGSGNCYEARMVVNTDSFGAPTANPNVVPAAKPFYNISCNDLLNDKFFNTTATGTIPSSSIISSLSATYNGNPVGIFQQVFPALLTSPPEPSNAFLAADYFLTSLGEDTAVSACNYYVAVGAASSCDQNGVFPGPSGTPLTFATWEGLSNIATSAQSVPPTYFVNVVDLNLTREHQSVPYIDAAGNTAFAAYVCNHLGPTDSNNDPVTVNLPASAMTQTQHTLVDNAVSNAVAGANLVACVAMDYETVSSGPNAGSQFTRFLIFGPSGELLPSVNLDGRGEKFVPGACIACHGGSTFVNATNPNIQASFIPYDIDNFAFSDQPLLTEQAQDTQIHSLNINIRNGPTALTNPTGAANNAPAELIFGWYFTSPGFNYVPTAWQSTANPSNPTGPPITNFTVGGVTYAFSQVYTDVIARSCRTCHTAEPNYNWDVLGPAGLASSATVNDDGPEAISAVCGTAPYMPNALVEFNRFWDSHINQGTLPSGTADQVAEFAALYEFYNTGTTGICTPPVFPTSTVRRSR